MILLLDLGNSRIKWAMVESGEFLAGGSVVQADALDAAWADMKAPVTVIGCSVVSLAAKEQIAAAVFRHWALPVQWLTPVAEQLGVRNHYLDPAKLGADRWAAVLGARARFPGQSLVVVSAGTALVVDAVTADGDFLGGMILPGYRLMKQALAGNTARLPFAQGEFTAFPQCTEDAIETGCLTALTSTVEAMVQRLMLSGSQTVSVILSGGDASQLAPLMNGKVLTVDNLALHGLAALAVENNKDVSQ